MSRIIFMNDRLVPEEEARVSVFDHGLLYGDGVFEGLRSYSGRVFRLDAHLDRLWASARAISLEIPLAKETVAKAVIDTLAANKLVDGYVRLLITRGAGSLGLDPNRTKNPQVIVIADTISLYPQEFYERGLRIVTAATQRVHSAALSPRIKSLNYLNNIIARLEVTRAGCLEGLMLNSEGYVAEATGDNIFILRDGNLLTPPVSAGILDGITRRTAIELAKTLGIETKEELFTVYDVYTSKECFLTGTAAEIAPVAELDGRVISDGKPGKFTRQLTELFHKLTQSEGTAF